MYPPNSFLLLGRLAFLVAAEFAPKESTLANIQGCINAAMNLDKDHKGENIVLKIDS